MIALGTTALNRLVKTLTCTSLLVWALGSDAAVPRLAVLDFEFNNLSVLPAREMELERVQSIAPMLRENLAGYKRYTLVPVAADLQQQANAGAGYLAAHPDSAAALGQKVGADLIVVGRLQKSNDLFAYLTADVIDVHAMKPVANFNVEIKGPITATNLTQHGVKRLAEQIDQLVSQQPQ